MAAEHFRRANDLDVRSALGAVQAPVLVVHGKDDPMPIAWARSLVEHLPDATLFDPPGLALLGSPEECEAALDVGVVDLVDSGPGVFADLQKPGAVLLCHRLIL